MKINRSCQMDTSLQIAGGLYPRGHFGTRASILPMILPRTFVSESPTTRAAPGCRIPQPSR